MAAGGSLHWDLRSSGTCIAAGTCEASDSEGRFYGLIPGVFTAGTPTHIVWTKIGTTVAFYKDGALISDCASQGC